MAAGKHRRPRTSPLIRGVIAAGTGTAALALPLLGATAASAAQPAKAPTTAQAAQQVKSVTYTTVKGDTLYGIAERYDTPGGWRQLYKDNRKAIGDDPRLIHAGLELTVRTTKKASTAGKTADKASAPAEKPAQSVAKVTQASAKTYANNLDGWIRQAMDIMAQKGIPGSYEGIHRNIMRESSGNPMAINNWDSNAAKGTPSKGLLQTIDPTFNAYHVAGTSFDPYDPVANIAAACNYAAARYGSIDNVFGAY
ncbi:LysM peptidoglycan-binding domain-containing protein [Streptomyces sp. NL15-2K]|uniref:LysM peptidoglycan-binding domain-containing protein n=1 Tax=Streptomyces sp. NL15-2K TaxID=376149 RepID=UPI000F561BDE|nr:MULTISPECIES: LysM peptidoglycan-binding domain-containing protein [Actinomycetes]WKX11661.1 LysM peptidoglycan-binding domain-containing protein [Kutzneria buriramensis]GCB46858.1 phage tail length tape-measure protein [Streptomyces sp. NL15-2K]